MQGNSQWKVGLFEVGDCGQCLYSYCCCVCAMASTRTHVDDSQCLFNLFCGTSPVSRYFVRTAYEIPGNATNDIAINLFCPCCSVNQMLQTAVDRGNPSIGVGSRYNTRQFSSKAMYYCTGASNDAGNIAEVDYEAVPITFSQWLYACFCTPCAIGSSLETSTGLPFILGCCCVNPWYARNITRYQYRIQGNEVTEECLGPLCLSYVFGGIVGLWGILVPLATIPTAQVVGETAARGPCTAPRYLSSQNKSYKYRRGEAKVTWNRDVGGGISGGGDDNESDQLLMRTPPRAPFGDGNGSSPVSSIALSSPDNEELKLSSPMSHSSDAPSFVFAEPLSRGSSFSKKLPHTSAALL